MAFFMGGSGIWAAFVIPFVCVFLLFSMHVRMCMSMWIVDGYVLEDV